MSDFTHAQLLAKGFLSDGQGGYRKVDSWSEQQIAQVRRYYAETSPDSFDLAAFAKSIGRTHAAVALKASRLGFSMPRGKRERSTSQRLKMSVNAKVSFEKSPRRLIEAALLKPNGFLGKSHTKEYRLASSAIKKKWFKNNPHPRGMLGKKHSEKTKSEMSKTKAGVPVPPERVMAMLKTKEARKTLYQPRNKTSWKAGWRVIGDKRIYARSSWEANYARYLDFQKAHSIINEWEHEPVTFWFDKIKRGVRSYLPDFRITTARGDEEFHEVKGWMDSRSKTKLKRMKKYYPNVKIILIEKDRMRQIRHSVAGLIAGWE